MTLTPQHLAVLARVAAGARLKPAELPIAGDLRHAKLIEIAAAAVPPHYLTPAGRTAIRGYQR